MVDLQRGVVEAEALVQHRLELAPGGVAVGVAVDEHVRGERREAGGDRPHVQVVDLVDPGTAAIARPTSSTSVPAGEPSSRIWTESRRIVHELARISRPIATLTTGSAYSQPVARMISAATITPTEPSRSAITWRSAAETLRLSPEWRVQDPRGDQVDGQAADRDRQHQPRLDLGRVAEAHPGLDEDPDRDRDQGDAVEERREDLGAAVAEGAARAPGAAGEPGGEQGDAEREAVGEHVRGVGEQRQAARDQAADDLGDEEERGQREDELQRALGAGAVEVDRVRVVVSAGAVHGSKVLRRRGFSDGRGWGSG